MKAKQDKLGKEMEKIIKAIADIVVFENGKVTEVIV